MKNVAGYRARAAIAVAGGAVALLAASCSSSAKSSTSSTTAKVAASPTTAAVATGAPYNIAFIGDLTGGNGQNGQPTIAAAEGAAYQINNHGGVNGHPLKISVVQDSQSTVAGAETAARTGLGSSVTFATGGMGGSQVAATASIFTAAGIPYIGTSYPVDALINQPTWFTLAPTGSQVAAGAVNGIKALLGGSLTGKTIGFEGLAVPTVDNNLAAIKALVEKNGGKMGPVIRDPLTFSSWSSQAANVASAHVDGFIVNHAESATAIIAKALGVAGVKGPIVSTEGASSDTLFQSISAANFYAVRETSESATAPGTAPAQAASAAGNGSASPLNPYFGREWGVIYVAAAALAKCGFPCSPSGFATSLEGLGDFTAPNDVYLGPINFSSKNHAGLTTAQVYSWSVADSKAVPSGSPFPLN
ncbi:MAG TPA: ABC transporter substrate-binding protein [Acidimicrobiales bacterium]|nr:ABC transporter substrate-binding protein [Acidimicrobiales bacterium]